MTAHALPETRRLYRPTCKALTLPRGWSRCDMPTDDGATLPTLLHEEAIVVVGHEADAPDVPQLEIIANYTPAAGSALEDLGRWLRAGGRL